MHGGPIDLLIMKIFPFRFLSSYCILFLVIFFSMRFSVIPIIAAAIFAHQGCKDNTEEVAGDAAIDGVNEAFGTKWTDDQKKKYEALAGMSKDDCTTKVAAGIENIVKNAELQKKLNEKGKPKIEPLKQKNDADRAAEAKKLAGPICDKLIAYKAAADKK